MSSKNYWREREERQRKLNIKNEAEYQKKLDDIYADMLENIEKEINGFYVKYAKSEGITMAEAKKRISEIDIESYAKKAKRYVKNKDLSKKANDEMRYYNAAMKINRLELLKANIGMHLVGGYDELEKIFGDAFTQRTEEEMRKQAGILGKTIQNNGEKTEVIVNASYKNATWSERIWAHQSMLKSEIDKLLQEGLIQGKHPSVLARHLEKRFGVSESNAMRLMVTELARVQTEAQKQSFIQNGFEEYEYIACEKADACSQCRSLDGKVFKVEDMMPGENAPPMHPYCHCSTAAHMDDNDYEKWLDTYSEHGLDFESWQQLKAQSRNDKIQLDEDELSALMKYKSFESYTINDLLRRCEDPQKLPEKDQQFVSHLDSALTKVPQYEGDLVRAVDFSSYADCEERIIKCVEEFVEKKEIIIDQYWSTSKEEGYNEEAKIVIYIQNSKKGRDISQLGLDEKEVLYERKSGFKVLSKKKVDGVWYILLREV